MVKKVNAYQTIDSSNFVNKLLIMIIEISILLHKKLTPENFTSRLAQGNLASKIDIANFVKKTNFDDKLKKVNEKSYFK